MVTAPDIIIPGIPKAGTTALAVLLSQHSRISLVSPKEPHYYSWGLDDRTGRTHMARILNTDEYHDAIRRARSKDEMVIDASTSYTHPVIIEDTVERLKQHCPNCRYILSVRDPMKRILSDWKMRAMEGWAPSCFSSAIQESINQLMDALKVDTHEALLENIEYNDDWIAHSQPNLPGSSTLISNGFYDRLLAPYHDHFGDRVLVIPQEMLNTQPEHILYRCLNHLGLEEENFQNTKQRYNSSEYRTETAFASFIKSSGLAPIAKSFLPNSLFQQAKSKLTRPVPPPNNDLHQHHHLQELLEKIYVIMNKRTHDLMYAQFDINWQYEI